MLKLPGSHIGFAFSDPAGANACMAMASLGANFYHQSSALFSNRNYQDALAEKVQTVQQIPDFAKLNLDCLFTGTSHPQSSDYFEVNCIEKAKETGIKVISFVDHWVNFKLRFLNEENEAVYPDEIWIVDERAKELATQEGLPDDKLVISGNPYHEYLKLLWKSNYNDRSYLEHLRIPSKKFTILFTPDPLSLRNDIKVLGFSEDKALEQLIKVSDQLPAPYQLIVKCHPLQPMHVFKDLINESSGNIHLITKADVLELLNASDVVIGFYSNILLEAEALGKKVIRFFPGKENADLLAHKISLPVVKDGIELLEKLKHCINE